MAALVNVTVEWLAWSDHGGGVVKGTFTPCTVHPKLAVKNMWGALGAAAHAAAPEHYSRLWYIRNGRFMHEQERTLESYGLEEGSKLCVLLRTAAPL